jgi:hypothetical protein
MLLVESHRDMVIKVHGACALSGLWAYECLTRGKVGQKHWREPDPTVELECGAPWSSQPETSCTRTKCKSVGGPGPLLGQV